MALSIKQPWAALVIAGVKTIEIRRWPTARRGRVLIHAARVPDMRDAGWNLVGADLQALAQLKGGIIGAVELLNCKRYVDQANFERDQLAHRNDPDWFESAGLYGFVFANPEKLAFHKYPGWFRFFAVPSAAELQTTP